MELCIGIIILIIVVVGGILVYAQFATAVANRKRITWARTLNKVSLPELEKMRAEIERQAKALQRERLLVAGHKRNVLDVEIGECNQRIAIIDSFIEEQNEISK